MWITRNFYLSRKQWYQNIWEEIKRLMKWKYFKEKSVLKKNRVLIKIIRIILPWFIVQKVEWNIPESEISLQIASSTHLRGPLHFFFMYLWKKLVDFCRFLGMWVFSLERQGRVLKQEEYNGKTNRILKPWSFIKWAVGC